MAKVKTTYENLAGEEATKPPVRKPVAAGQYLAAIIAVALGATRGAKPLSKMTVQYQIIHRIEEGKEPSLDEAGRRVFQDYILEDDGGEMSELRRFDLRQLLDAAQVPFDDNSFDTDDFLTEPHKKVVITVKHREGAEVDENGEKRIFANVTKVDGNIDLKAELAAGDII
jgi:hypothetical protein